MPVYPGALASLQYPSLRAKKYDESADLWQARVNKDWRFYFTITDDTYRIARCNPPPKISVFCCSSATRTRKIPEAIMRKLTGHRSRELERHDTYSPPETTNR